jgi:hypothetical protein
MRLWHLQSKPLPSRAVLLQRAWNGSEDRLLPACVCGDFGAREQVQQQLQQDLVHIRELLHELRS